MKVIFGSCIEVIIDPQMDLGETIGMYMLWCITKPAAVGSQQPLASQQWEVKCVLWLSSPRKTMILRWVQSPLISQTIKKKHIIPLWRLKDKLIIFSFDTCFQWCSLCSGVFVHCLILLVSTSCVFRGLAALSMAGRLWFDQHSEVREHSLTSVVRSWFSWMVSAGPYCGPCFWKV